MMINDKIIPTSKTERSSSGQEITIAKLLSNPKRKSRINLIMKLIEARVNGNPRQVSTKFGEKSVMDVVTADGQEIAIWRPAGDREVMGRVNGERVSITIDSKGKASLVEHASNCPAVGLASTQPAVTLPFEAEMKLKQQMGFQTEPQPSRSVEIADYVNRLGKLYSHCMTTAANMPTSIELETPQIKDVATTFFIQAIKHFNL